MVKWSSRFFLALLLMIGLIVFLPDIFPSLAVSIKKSYLWSLLPSALTTCVTSLAMSLFIATQRYKGEVIRYLDYLKMFESQLSGITKQKERLKKIDELHKKDLQKQKNKEKLLAIMLDDISARIRQPLQYHEHLEAIITSVRGLVKQLVVVMGDAFDITSLKPVQIANIADKTAQFFKEKIKKENSLVHFRLHDFPPEDLEQISEGIMYLVLQEDTAPRYSEITIWEFRNMQQQQRTMSQQQSGQKSSSSGSSTLPGVPAAPSSSDDEE